MLADQRVTHARNRRTLGFSLTIALLAFVVPASRAAAAAQAPPPPALAQDGRGLVGESFATRAMFTAVWGDRAAAEWIQEHNAALSGGQPATGPHIAYFSSSGASTSPAITEGFAAGLRDAGYIPGQTITIEWRFSDGRNELLPALATELVNVPVDVIAAVSTPESLAAKQATSTIPIVTLSVGDPVGSALVASLDHPGGNITGALLQPPDANAQQLAVLKEAVPSATRLAVLANRANLAQVAQLARARDAATRLGMDLVTPEVRSGDDLPAAFSMMTQQHADALYVLADPVLGISQPRIRELATAGRLPTLYQGRAPVDGGGRMSYGIRAGAAPRLGAGYVAKILHGAKPADLPMSAPNQFELVVNLQAAQAIGFTFPPSILAKATDVIR